MYGFVDLDATFSSQPRELGPVLARIDTGRGREDLFEDQAPQVLRQLSENARIPSITASNAIEGVTVDTDRALKIADGAPRFRNRNEKEFAGYRDAIDSLMRMDAFELLNIPLILQLHLEQAPASFRRRDLERALPGVSPATIRLVLNQLRDEGHITVDGGGAGARWQRT